VYENVPGKRGYRPWCSSCRKKRAGLPIGTWQRRAIARKEEREAELRRLAELWIETASDVRAVAQKPQSEA